MRGQRTQVPVDALAADLETAADKLAAMRLIMERSRAVALADKMGMLADRMNQVPAALHARADAVVNRLNALEAHGNNTFSGLEAVISDAEAGVTAAEAALAKLTNVKP